MSDIDADDFFRKVAKIPLKVKKSALTLWFLLLSTETPLWAKSLIVTCLLYLLNPFDLIPDFLPCGLADDLSAMVSLIASVNNFVTEEIEEQVESKM